jgi:hypothetical protein
VGVDANEERGPQRVFHWGRPALSTRGRSRIAIIILVAVPVLALGVPPLFGRPLLYGDAADQTFPLRALAGAILGEGHLPLWDRYIWSGTPLLGGFNASALFPATLLYAFLPAQMAWAVGAIAAYVIGGLGAYAFMRDHGLVVGASLIGAATFAFGGTMVAQYGHMDMVDGVCLMPWGLLALRRIAFQAGSVWGWVAVLGLVMGVLCLTGEPETILYVSAAFGLYCIALLPRAETKRSRLLMGALGGAGVGVALGSLQWLVGLDWEGLSQRAKDTYAFFSSFSLPVRQTILSIFPFLQGGAKLLGEPAYMGPADLTELNGYVGMLPLVAAVALLFPHWRRRAKGADLATWYAIGALALLFAWGGHGPLGPLLYRVPYWGAQRGSSRNLATLDMSLAMLAAFLVDGLLRTPQRWERAHRLQRLVPAVPFAMAVGLRFAWSLSARAVLARLTVPNPSEIPDGSLASIGYYLDWACGISAAAALAVIYGERLRRRTRLLGLMVLVGADLAVFAAGSEMFWTYPTAALKGEGTAELVARRLLLGGGRFGIYLPGFGPIEQTGPPDLNIPARLESVNGYGSIVYRSYAMATGAHEIDYLSPAALANGTLDQLGLTTLLTAPSYLQTSPATISTTHFLIGAGAAKVIYLGEYQAVRRVVARVVRGSQAHLKVGLVLPNGKRAWLPRGFGNGIYLPPGPIPAEAVVIEAAKGQSLLVSAPEVFGIRGVSETLDGPLAGALSPPRWIFRGNQGGLSIFLERDATPHLVLLGAHGSARLLHESLDGSEVDQVRTDRAASLVRDVAWAPGWQASLEKIDGSGPAFSEEAHRHGLVQEVVVPEGAWKITWSYHAPGLDSAEVAAAFGIVAILALAVAEAWSRRGHRPA